jgi:hypothetical protein
VNRRTLLGGLGFVAAFGVLAAVSGRLSPLARSPLLDGGALLAPYRWVTPPPDLASTNQPPATGQFTLRVASAGSLPNTFVTSDNQTTLSFAKGAVPAHGAATEARVSVQPEDPATLPSPPDGLTAFGNAVRLVVTYAGGGSTAKFDAGVELSMVYPVTLTLHAASHEILWSRDGSDWRRLPSKDSAVLQQVTASAPGPGYVLVGGVATTISSTPSPTPGESNSLSTVLLVVAGASFLIGIGLIVRGRRRA